MYIVDGEEERQQARHFSVLPTERTLGNETEEISYKH